MWRKGFYDTIVLGINTVDGVASPSDNPEDLEQEFVPEIECQRRAIMLCAYETTRRWAKLFPPNLEHHAHFWSLYRLFMVCATRTASLALF